MNFIVENEQQLIDKVWEQIEDKLVAGFRCALIGDLGAGKTTLVKAIASKLGIKDHITSPTFNIRKEYKIDEDSYLQHIDLYRHEAGCCDNAEVFEWLEDPRAITFVEWPERASSDYSGYNLVISIEALDSHSRRVKLKWN